MHRDDEIVLKAAALSEDMHASAERLATAKFTPQTPYRMRGIDNMIVRREPAANEAERVKVHRVPTYEVGAGPSFVWVTPEELFEQGYTFEGEGDDDA